MRLLGGSGGSAWKDDHPWASIYPWVVEHRVVGHGLARLAMQTDLGLLWAAAAEVGEVADGGAILDVPCGGGVALRGLRPEQAVRYVAADIAPAMLARTRRAASRRGLGQVEAVEADVGSLPFADATFELVVSLTGLHCFPDPRAAIDELGRCARPGGRLTGSAFLDDAGLRFAPTLAAGRRAGLLGPGLDEPQLRRWLAAAGFEEVEAHRSGALTYFRARRA